MESVCREGLMKFEEQSYNSKWFRPSPEIYLDDGGTLLIVSTAWGSPNGAKKVNQTISDYFLASTADREVTTPFRRLTCLSSLANSLRIATLLANDRIYREDNREEFSTGVELFAAALNGSEFVYVQIGHPNLLVLPPMGSPQPLSVQADLSFDIARDQDAVPPLPGQLLGVEETCNFAVQSFQIKQGDKLLLVSRTLFSPLLVQPKSFDVSIDKIGHSLAKEKPQLPFWLGLIEF